jgi:hypothetical protein
MIEPARIEAIDEVAEVKRVHLPASRPPWTDTGLRLRAGEIVTWLAEGRCVLVEEAGLWMGPRYALWGRVGDEGEIFNGTRASHTFTATRDGTLWLATYQGEWADRRGALATPVEAYAALSGGLDVTLIRWRGDPAAGLRALASEPLARGESERLEAPHAPPPGWRYLWFLGEAEVFRAIQDGSRPAIEVVADDDLGILQKPVEFPLSPQTRIEWQWRVSTLPAESAEDSLPTHDYVSLALEFDNGRDLTWYWSAALPPEAHYHCPLPQWNERETHLVVRSGAAGLGEWYAESRLVRADYERAVGDPPPRIVGVWLIAVSVFGHRSVRATFADICIRDGESAVQIL